MSTVVQSNLIPAGENTWYVLEDKYLKGGLRTIPSLRSWASVPVKSRKSGGMIMCEDTQKLYVTDYDLVHLSEFRLPAARKRTALQFKTFPILFNDKQYFQIPMAFSSTVYKIKVDNDCIIKAYGTPEKDEVNPYVFYAKGEARREDNGQTYLPDGTVSKNNKFFRLTNMEDPPTETIYFEVINKLEIDDATVFTIDIVYYPEEY